MSKFLRFVRIARIGRSSAGLPAKVMASALIGMVAAGCSSDMTRFDFPAFGLTEANPRSRPVPAEPVYNKVADSQGGYGQAFGAEPGNGSVYGDSYGAPDYGGYGPTKKSYEVSGLPPTEGPGGIDGDEYLAGRGAAGQNGGLTTIKRRKPVESYDDGASDGDTVVVRPGDTIYRIARNNGVSVAALMAENNLSSPSISVGSTLRLPGRGQLKPIREVKARSSVYDSEPLPGANGSNSLDDNPYEEGSAADAPLDQQPIKAKPRKALLTKAGTYKVKSGDTFASIARDLGVSQKALAQANDVADTSKLKEGQILHMPGAGYDSVDRSDDPFGSLKAEKAAALDQSSNDPVAKDDDAVVAKPAKKKVVAAIEKPSSDADSAVQSDADAAGFDEPSIADSAVEAPVKPKAEKVAKVEPKSDDADVSEDAKLGKAASTGFRWPVRGRIVAKFGKLPDGSQNDGINVAVPMGTDVHAAEEGTVAYAGSELKGFGNLVLIRHADNWVTAYAHNQSILVKRGDKIKRGQVIAKAGKTGTVDQPQVHFELRKGSRPVDPLPHMASN